MSKDWEISFLMPKPIDAHIARLPLKRTAILRQLFEEELDKWRKNASYRPDVKPVAGAAYLADGRRVRFKVPVQLRADLVAWATACRLELPDLCKVLVVNRFHAEAGGSDA